ncbi:MAG: amidase family protein [Trueperaceae bacterium]|nr:amidase family protein [Trueperaceae bacterium]
MSGVPTVTAPFSVDLRAARAPSAGEGWTFACKEMFDVAGHPATCGHPRFAALRGSRPTSAVVSHFQAAGAVLLGKTIQSELAFSSLGESRFYPVPVNPRWPGRVPGGSSSGCAAAVASGSVSFSLATDSAGSARIPAACCGVLGLSLGALGAWLRDAVVLSPTCDQLGVLAPDHASLRRAVERLIDLTEASHPPRVVVPEDLVAAHCSRGVARRFGRVVGRLRAEGVAVEACDSAALMESERVQRREGVLVLAEIAMSLADFLREVEDVSPAVRGRLAPYLGWSDARVDELRSRVLAPLVAFRQREDAPLLLPTLPVPPPKLGAPAALGSLTKFANLLSESSISVPTPEVGCSVMLMADRPAELLAFSRLLASMRRRTGVEA